MGVALNPQSFLDMNDEIWPRPYIKDRAEAETELKRLQTVAYARIAARGHTISHDNSFLRRDSILGEPEGWQPYLLIWTNELIADILAMKPFDTEPNLAIIQP